MRYLRYSVSFNVQKEAGLYLKLFWLAQMGNSRREMNKKWFRSYGNLQRAVDELLMRQR